MAKRHADLFGSIANFGALRTAAKRALAGKRKKPGAAAFSANAERELLGLENELRDGTYRPGRYVEILVKEPKERLVSAAPFRDRVEMDARYHGGACLGSHDRTAVVRDKRSLGRGDRRR